MGPIPISPIPCSPTYRGSTVLVRQAMALIENPGPKTELQCVRKLLALNIQLMDELLN